MTRAEAITDFVQATLGAQFPRHGTVRAAQERLKRATTQMLKLEIERRENGRT